MDKIVLTTPEGKTKRAALGFDFLYFLGGPLVDLFTLNIARYLAAMFVYTLAALPAIWSETKLALVLLLIVHIALSIRRRKMLLRKYLKQGYSIESCPSRWQVELEEMQEKIKAGQAIASQGKQNEEKTSASDAAHKLSVQTKGNPIPSTSKPTAPSVSIRQSIDRIRSLLASKRHADAQALFDSIVRKNPAAENDFAQLLKLLNLSDVELLDGYHRADPRYKAGPSDTSFRTALRNSLSQLSIDRLKEVNEVLNRYIRQPDLMSSWRFGLFEILYSEWVSETDAAQAISGEVPSYNQPIADIVDQDWEAAVELFRIGTDLWEQSGSQDHSRYTDLLVACFFCGIRAATAYLETTSEEGIKAWVWAIGANRKSEDRLSDFGISDKGIGSSGHMKRARRFAEEVLGVCFEAPAGTNPDDNRNLDGYDWDEVARTVYEEC
jgi:hypothetical protein